MPIFRIDHQLVYYAHVPKCGGSSIANYIADRFGALGFYDTGFHNRPETLRWTRSSPQHVDVITLSELIPLEYFAAVFAFVRHPVPRAVSCYHFQAEVEKSIPAGQSFTDWLRGLAAGNPDKPFAFDNHTRPMTDIVPEGATVFHLEYGADQLIPWVDALAGQAEGPRAIPPDNVRGQHVHAAGGKVTPSAEDMALISEIYSADFKRFNYDPGRESPLTPTPRIDADFLAARDRDLKAAARPFSRLKRRIRGRLHRV